MHQTTSRLRCSAAAAGACTALCCSAESLAQLAVGQTAWVLRIRPAEEETERQLNQRLMEIGFVEGEPVRVIAHGYPGREPIAVRIGGTTFALRRFEADRILVTLREP